MNVNMTPGPGMPGIENFSSFGPVGVASPRCTMRSDRTQPLNTRPQRRSPLNWISNGLLRYALRAPLRRQLLNPRSWATKPPGSNPRWWKPGGTSYAKLHQFGIRQLGQIDLLIDWN